MTEKKREQLEQLRNWLFVKDTAVIGAVATNLTEASDTLEVAIFLHPLDYHIVPAEGVWLPEENWFDSAYSSKQGIRLAFRRLDWHTWLNPSFDWPETDKGLLSNGWLFHDPQDKVAPLIKRKSYYSDQLRFARLDEALVRLDALLMMSGTADWEKHGPAIAHDRLQAAYRYLVDGLFALHRRWQVPREKEMQHLLALPWLPPQFEARILELQTAVSPSKDAYEERFHTLKLLFQDFTAYLVDSGDYMTMPVDQALLRTTDEPGRPWNMEDWQKHWQIRRLSTH